MGRTVRRRIFVITKGRKRRTKLRMTAGPPLFYAALCVLGAAAGIWINGHYYERAKIYFERAKIFTARPLDGQDKENATGAQNADEH